VAAFTRWAASSQFMPALSRPRYESGLFYSVLKKQPEQVSIQQSCVLLPAEHDTAKDESTNTGLQYGRFLLSFPPQQYPTGHQAPSSHLFCPPSSIGVSHIRGRLDLRCELKGAIGQTNTNHYQTSDKSKCIALNDD
jgi:hypothetical protein